MRAYIESGDQYIATKNYPEAIIQYRNALAVDASFGEARLKLAAAYEVTGDLRNALFHYVRAADLMPDNVAAQLPAAKMLLAAGQFPEAKARAIAALAKDPKNVAGLIVLGNSLAGLKDVDGAISQLEQAIDAEPRVAYSYANLGLLQARKGDQAAAEAAFKRATEVDPKSVQARLNLGSFYWASRDLVAAERELKAAFAIDPKSPPTNRLLATFYDTTGRRAEVEPYLKGYAAATADIDPKLALADFYLAGGKTKEALDVLEPLSKDNDGFGPAKLRLAAIDFQAGRRPRAYQTLEEILTRFPKHEQTLEAKMRFSIAERKWDEALKVADIVIEANPQAATTHYLRGVTLTAKGSSDEAVKAFQRVLELVPAAIPAQMQLANLHLMRGDTQSAIDLLNPLVKSQPEVGAIRLLMGQALLQVGNLAGAEAHLVPLAKANPSSAEIHTWVGRLYAAKGQLTEARQAFSRANQLEPNSVVALNGLVTLDIIEKQPDAARARLENRLASSPNDIPLLFLAGNSYLTMGDTNRAEALIRKVLDLDSAHMDAYSRLVSMYLSENRLDEAKANLEEAARHQTKPVAPATMIGMILEMQNKPAEARKQYELALSLDPNAPVAANNLAWQYAEAGSNLDVALALAQSAKAKLPDDGRISDTLGWIYFKKGLTTLAITNLLQGTKQSPSAPAIHYHLGLAYLKSGDPRRAQQSLQQALKLNPQFEAADDAKRVLATIKG